VILLGALGLLVATCFCASAARALQARLGGDSRSADVLVFLLLMVAVQSLLILAAGLTGTLSFWPLTLFSAGGWALLQLRKPPRPVLPTAPGGFLGKALLAMAAVGTLALVVKAFLLSPSTGDALMYHLPKIAEWVQGGRFVWGLNHDPRQWFSAGFELLETWWVVFLHHDALIEIAGLQMTLIAFASIYTLAESLGARPGLAAVVYVFIPSVILGATSCGNDLAVASLTLGGYALVAAGAPRPLQAFPLLLAFGIKATGGFAALGVLAFAFFQGCPRKLRRGETLALAAAGLVLAGFWYARNWIVAGHPLYPFRGSHGEFTWSPQQGGIDVEQLQHTVQVLPRRMLDPYPFESMCRRITGWGWAVLPLGVPALLLALREDRRIRALALSFLFGACATLACVWFQDSNLRFVLWFPALFALSLARRSTPLWVTAALLACALNFAATLVPYELRESRHLWPPPSLPPDAPVACVFRDMAPSYRLYNRDFSRTVSYPRSMEDLRRSGAKYVYLYDPPDWALPIREWPDIGGRFHEVP
jgi:hypothetical protein